MSANDTSVALPLWIPESLAVTGSKRSIADVVEVLPGGVGLRLKDNVTLDESLYAFDWAMAMHDRVQFLIGDLINASERRWGEKYHAALNATGLARTTVKKYASVSARIPSEKRQAALSYTHHREILAIGDDQKVEQVLKELAAQAAKGHAPTTRELADKVRELAPPKVKTPKHGKNKKAKPDLPPYEPDAEEQSRMDAAEEKAKELADAIMAGADDTAMHTGDLFKVLVQCDGSEKSRWLELLRPIIEFYDLLRRFTR